MKEEQEKENIQFLKQIDLDIATMLQRIANKRKITPEEMKKYSRYISDYYEMSLEKNFDTLEMSKIFSLSAYLSYPNMPFNVQGKGVSKETSAFFRKEFETKDIFGKYDAKVLEIIKRLELGQEVTIEEFKRYDQIFCEYSYPTNIDTEDNVKIIRALEEKSKALQVRSRTIENQIEQYIYDNITGSKTYENVGFYETILNYYGTQLSGDAIEINKNSAISHLIRAAQKGQLPQNVATIVLDRLEARKKRDEIQISDNDSLEEYMQKVAEIRLQKGRMPRECSEFIIKQSILPNKDIINYWGMIERALEDFSEYELEDSKLENYSVMVLDQPFLGKDSNGQYTIGKKIIKLSRTSLQLLGMFKMLETSLHEITHAEQYAKIENGQLNRDTYKILKEEILRNKSESFYDTNYNYMYNEIDARKSGYVRRLRVLKRIGLTDSEIVEAQYRNLEPTIKKYRREYEEGKMKKVGEEKKDVNAIFLEHLQSNPELLNQYPALNVEFEKNGDNIQRKSLAKILGTYEQMLCSAKNQEEVQRISSFCSEILLNGGNVPAEKMQEELANLMGFKSDNPIINSYKNKVLKTKFSPQMVMLNSMKAMYNNHSQRKRMEIQQVFKEVAQRKDAENFIPPNENDERR